MAAILCMYCDHSSPRSDETDIDEAWSSRYNEVIKYIETDSEGSDEIVLTVSNVKPPFDE